MMIFKQLPISAKFEFDYSDLDVPFSGQLGPWIKISARKYIMDTTPFGTDEECHKHNKWQGLENQVGTINVKVIE